MRALRHAWGASIGLAATDWMLRIGTFFLRTEAELVFKSRNVTPIRRIEAGFQFQFAEWRPPHKIWLTAGSRKFVSRT
jgi:uncharacterized protein